MRAQGNALGGVNSARWASYMLAQGNALGGVNPAWRATYMLAQGNALGGFIFGPVDHLNASPGQRPGGISKVEHA
jgi:hypothetical protein